MHTMLIFAALAGLAAADSSLFDAGKTTTGYTVCGGNPVVLQFVGESSDGDSTVTGSLAVRSDIKRAEFEATATLAGGEWSVASSDWVLEPAHELCDCPGDDCDDAVDGVCGDNVYAESEMTALCTACPAPANTSEPGCAEALTTAMDTITCGDELPALCDCSGVEGSCNAINDHCSTGAVNDTAICDPCDADYTSPYCEGNITAVLQPMVETQQCGDYADAMCVCEGLSNADRAVSAECGTAAYGTLGDATYGFVATTCFVSYSWASDECHEAVQTAVEMHVAQQHCYVYEAPSFCRCRLGSESDECQEATRGVCYTDTEYADSDMCTECLANATSPACQTEMSAALAAADECDDVMCHCADLTDPDCGSALGYACTVDFAGYYDICWNCAAVYDQTLCVTALMTKTASLTCDSGAEVDPDADGICDEAPDCDTLNREACAGSNMCGECADGFWGDPAPSNERCTGVNEGCELLHFEGGELEYANDTYYAWDESGEPYFQGGMHWIEVLDADNCADTPRHVYRLNGIDAWGINDNWEELTAGLLMVTLSDSVQVPPSTTWFEVTDSGSNQHTGITVSCASADDEDRTVPRRVAERIRDSALAGAPSDLDTYALATVDAADDDYCTDFMWAAGGAEISGANVYVTSLNDRRVVAYSPDADEYLRVVESDDLGPARDMAFLPNGTLVVADETASRLFDPVSGAYLGNFLDVYGQFGDGTDNRLPCATRISRDGTVLYQQFRTNTDPDATTQGAEIEVWELDDGGHVGDHLRVYCTAHPVTSQGNDIAETWDEQWLYVLQGTAIDGTNAGRVIRCPTPQNADAWNAVNESDTASVPNQGDRRCVYGCEVLSETHTWYAGGIAVLPDGSYLVSEPDNSVIVRHDANGAYMGDFASLSSTGLDDFYPNRFAIAPSEDVVYVTDESASSPYVFDFQGNLLGTLAAAVGFATSGSGIVVRPGLYAPRSTYSISGSLVAGEDIVVTLTAIDAVGAVVADASPADMAVAFASLITIGGEALEVGLDAEVVAGDADGEFVCTYAPTVTGDYEVQVTDSLFRTAFEGGPTTVTVAAAPADAAASTVSGDGLLAHAAGTPATFTVALIDEFGNALPAVDGANVTVRGVPDPVLEDNGDGTIDVTYTSDEAGQYLINVYLDGALVAASPYVVFLVAAEATAAESTISHEAAPHVPGAGEGVEQVVVNYELIVELRDQFGNALGEAGHADRLSASAPCDGAAGFEDLLDGTYAVACAVQYPADAALVHVYLDGEELGASPHALDYAVTVEVAGAALFAAFAALAALCFVLTVGVLVVAYAKRTNRIMNAASPPFMYLIAIGCLLEFVVAILYGVDSDVADDAGAREAVCRARPWFIGVGFQLVFGSLFAKTWRIGVIFNNKGLKKVTCKTSTLVKIVCAFVGLEVLYLAAWTGVDPMELTIEVKSSGVDELVVFERCVAEHQGVWLALNYGYKGVILLWGTKLAYGVRGVTGRFNESRFIALALYNMLIMGAILVPVSHLVWDSPVASFMLAAAGIVLSCTVIIGLLFGSKFVSIFMYGGKDPSELAGGHGTAGTQSTTATPGATPGATAASHTSGSAGSNSTAGGGAGNTGALVAAHQRATEAERKLKDVQMELERLKMQMQVGSPASGRLVLESMTPEQKSTGRTLAPLKASGGAPGGAGGAVAPSG